MWRAAARRRARAGSDHHSQLDSDGVLYLANNAYPSLWSDDDVTLIVLTGHDLWWSESPWGFVYGKYWSRDPSGGFAVISDARMDDRAFGGPPNDPALRARLLAMIGKYTGALYYGLALSEDPTSPMFHPISHPFELERMGSLRELLTEMGLLGAGD